MRSPVFQSADSVSVVVGASRGLGLAMARELLTRAPGRVIACSRSPNESRGLAALLQAHGPDRVHMLAMDVTQPESVATLAETVRESYGHTDLLLNVAGILHEKAEGGGRMPERRLASVEADWMARVYAVNAIGPVLTTQALQRTMRPGAVVANLSARVGSIGDNGLGGWWSYRMSKAALNMATANMAIELRRSEVIAVALHPGTTATDLSEPFQRNVKPEKLFPAERTAGMLLDVLQGLTIEESGGFFAYDGSRIEW